MLDLFERKLDEEPAASANAQDLALDDGAEAAKGEASHHAFELAMAPERDLDQEAAGGFAEQQSLGGRGAGGHAIDVDLEAAAAGNGHLGGRYGQATLREIVAAEDQVAADATGEPAHDSWRFDPSSGQHARVVPKEGEEMRAAHISIGRPDDIHGAAGGLEIHGDASADVGHGADGGDQQRSGDGVALAAGDAGVSQAVLAAYKRSAIAKGGIPASLSCSGQGAELLGVVNITPTEVVEQGNAIYRATSGDDVAQCLVDGKEGHLVGIDLGG